MFTRSIWGALALALALTVPSLAADAPQLREWGMRVAGGINPSSVIEYYAIHPHVGFSLWKRADQWLADRNISGLWVIEPWVAYVRDAHGKHQTESFEIGVSPLFARLTFGTGRVRPFIDGGEGILYTDLRKQGYGSRVQFSSQFGAGLEYEARPDLGVVIGARFRHTSNAGLAEGNPGINTIFGMVGVTFR